MQKQGRQDFSEYVGHFTKSSAPFASKGKSADQTLKVQLKSRVTISTKYVGRNIWMAFPHKSLWYLIEHDQLVEKIGKHTTWLLSPSWRSGAYSSVSINPELLNDLAENKLGPVYGPIVETDERE